MDRVSHTGQAVRILLVGAEFRGGRTFQYAFRDDFAARAAVEEMADAVHHGFGDILDDRESSRHIAVEGAVPVAISLLLPVVSTSQPNLLERAMSRGAPNAGLDVLFGHIRRDVCEHPGKSVQKCIESFPDGQLEKADAEICGQKAGVGVRSLRSILGGHGNPDHVLIPERPHRDSGHQAESTPPESPMTAMEKPFLRM